MARTPEQNLARRDKEAEAKRQKRAKAKAAPPRKPAAKKKAPVKAKGKRKSPAAPVAAKVPVKKPKVVKPMRDGEREENPALMAMTPPVTVSKGSPPVHTMARSYVRRSGAGQGKERHGTYQCTVSFTEPQMVQIRAASQLRGVSLAEMIRSAVVGHLNRGIQT